MLGLNGTRKTMWWFCKFCFENEKALPPYGIGDKEICVSCGEGTAIVLTKEDLRKMKDDISTGRLPPKRCYT